MKTLKDCQTRANELIIPIAGDWSYRGACPVEDADLCSFFAWVRLHYPQYYSLIFHPESEMPVNGGSSYGYHAKSSAKGRVDNLPDIICLPINYGSPAFCCELKRKDISKSLGSAKRKAHFEKQLLRLQSHKQHGAFVCIALGLDNAKHVFKQYVETYGQKK